MKREIGNIIQTFRISCGFKQVYMAYNLGISTQAYANLEHGRSDLNTGKLEQIASLYKIKPHQIIILAEELNKHKNLELIKNSISSILNSIRI